MRAAGAGRVVLSLTVASCGGNGVTAPVASVPAQPGRAVVRLAVIPDPVTSGDGGGTAGHQRTAAWTLTVTETAGVGATLNFLNLTLRDAASGVVADPGGEASLAAADVETLAGATRLAPRGTLTLPCRLVYGLPEGSPGGRLMLTLQLTDDSGQLVSGSVTAQVD